MLDKIESGTRVFVNIRQIENLKILEVTEEDFEVALGYSKKYGLLSNDAIHVATMKQHGITNIATKHFLSTRKNLC